MILLINVGFYLATVVHSSRSGTGGGMDVDGTTLFDFGAKFGPAIFAGQWWRLITAGFLHGGLLHIGMNLWVLFDLGAQVEEHFGTSRYLVVYFVSNMTAFLTSTYWAPRTLSIGASGALFGLIGAMLALSIRDRSLYGATLRRQYIRWAIYGLLFGLLPGIDNSAHLGGLAGGFVIGFICGEPGYSKAVERIWQIAASVAVGITAFAFAQMFLWLASPK